MISQILLLGSEVILSSVTALNLTHTLTEMKSPLSKIVTLNYLKFGPKLEKTYCKLKDEGGLG